MSEIRFTAKLKGASDVARLLRRHPEKVGRTLESLVKQEARGMAVELARVTRPSGFSQKAKRRGEQAVARDVGGFFASPSDAYEMIRRKDPAAAERFWAQMSKRQFSRAQQTLQDSGSDWSDLTVGRLDAKHHVWSARGASKPRQVVTSEKARATYIARIQKRVGFAKASWINAGKAIGGRVRGAAQWATRHRQAPGTATVRSGDKPAVTLINRLDYLEATISKSSVNAALIEASAKLRKALAVSLQRIHERTHRVLRRAG